MPDLETPTAPSTQETKQFIGEGAEPNQPAPDREKAAAEATKYRENLNRELRDRSSRKARDYFEPRRDLDGGGEPEEEPKNLSPSEYLQWRKTGKIPEAEQAQGAEGDEGTGEHQNAEEAEESALLESARQHDERTEKEVRALLDRYRDAPAAPAVRKILDLAKGDPDFPRIASKLAQPFFRDAHTAEGQARTQALEAALTTVSNDSETQLALYRDGRLQSDMHSMTPQQVHQAAINTSVALKLSAAREAYGDFDRVVSPAIERIVQNQAAPAVLEALGGGRHMTDVLYLLGKDPAELASFANLARTNPMAAIRKAVVLDHLVHEELRRSGKLPRPEPTVARAAPLRRPTSRVTSAPPPPTEIGGKAQKAPDALDEALKNGDVQAYRRELNRQMRGQ